MTRIGLLLFAGLAYLIFLATITWAVLFLAGLPGPDTIDDGPGGPAWAAVLADLGLLTLFAVHHSVLARPAVKRRLARWLPAAAERSGYVLIASLLLGLLCWQWRPLPGAVWHVRVQPWTGLLWGVFAAGWLIAVSATYMIDHFDFSGLRQARWAGRGDYRAPVFAERWLYQWVRHPMMAGLLLAFWATPRMTAGHLLFAAAASVYIAVGIRFEERDLRRQLGPAYRAYAARVPALVPRPGRAPSLAGADVTDGAG